MKKVLLSLLFALPLMGKSGVTQAKYSYTMSLYYETNLNTNSCRASAYVNGKALRCHCGDDPIVIMIVYGHVQGFCFYHLPQIDIDMHYEFKGEELLCLQD